MKKTSSPASILPLFLLGACLAAHADPVPTNSLVRFRITHGTSLQGEIDVELFDREKPVTVSNFLAYVETHRYDRSLLHRCVPRFVLQGGAYTVASSTSASSLTTVAGIPRNPPITNEFSVGPLRSNVYGTIAMAKLTDQPDSAQASWFFNLANNSTNLDHQNGGYTVFGQVVVGEAVLSYFNTLQTNNQGVIDMTDINHTFLCPEVNVNFPSLPVAYLGAGCPRYADLFTVTVTVLRGPDVALPLVSIATPKPRAVITADTVEVRGSASDNVGLDRVRLRLNGGDPFPATGSNSWTAVVTNIPPGTNVVEAEAIDVSGLSSRATVPIFRSVKVPLELGVVGAGKVSGPTNGQLLELTRPSTLVARPAKGNFFNGWSGSVTSLLPTLRFNMQSNTSFTAEFVTNRYPEVKGTYNGVFFDTNQVELLSSGFLSLALTDQGKFTARMLRGSRTTSYAGTFPPTGGVVQVTTGNAFDRITLHLAIDLDGPGDPIRGVVSNVFWSVPVVLEKAVFQARLHSPALAGSYTWTLPFDAGAAAGLGGESYGTLKIDGNGRVTAAGVLADTTPFAARSALSGPGAVPFYVPLYRGQGALVSSLLFDTNQPDSDFSGLLNWFKLPQSRVKFYAAGLTNESVLAGMRYLAPTTNRVLVLTEGSIGFTNGNLAADFATPFTLEVNNKFTSTGTNKLVLTLVKPTGLLSGSAVPLGVDTGISTARPLIVFSADRGIAIL